MFGQRLMKKGVTEAAVSKSNISGSYYQEIPGNSPKYKSRAIAQLRVASNALSSINTLLFHLSHWPALSYMGVDGASPEVLL